MTSSSTMGTPDRPTVYSHPNGHHPTSPPMTPGARSNAPLPPSTGQTSTIYKRMGAMFTQSPPLDFIEPIDQGPQFRFTRPQSSAQSSRPSTASGRACPTTPQHSDHESESDEESVKEIERITRRVEKAEFVLEEYESDPGYDCDIEVVLPDHYEDARSENSEDERLLDRLEDLRCQTDSSDEDEQERMYRKKKKRWSAGIFKRSHSQSIEGDSSYSDNDPLDDVDSSARRLRRRVRGPSDRSSLIFEDRGFSSSNNILEVEEPEDEGIPHTQGPPSIPSDDGFTLDELPFWPVRDQMDFEIEFL